MSATSSNASGSNNADTDISVQRIPAWIKAGATALILVLVLIGLFIANQSDSTVAEPENTLTTLESQLQLVKPESADIENDLENEASEITIIEPSHTESKQALAQSQHNLIQIETLQSQLAQSQQSADTTQQQFVQLSSTVQELISQLNSMQQTVLQLQANAAKKKTAVRQKRRPLAKLKAPFTLVSIDHWGDQLNVVLRYNSQIFTLRQGVTFQGWLIDFIDLTKESVTLKNAQGQTVTLKISG